MRCGYCKMKPVSIQHVRDCQFIVEPCLEHQMALIEVTEKLEALKSKFQTADSKRATALARVKALEAELERCRQSHQGFEVTWSIPTKDEAEDG